MYTSPGSTFANICTRIKLQFFISCLTLSNCYGFKINVYETSTINPNVGHYWSTPEPEPEPSERDAEWWESLIVVTLASLAVLGFFGFFLIVRHICRRAANAAAQESQEASVRYNRNRSFRRRELADWPRPQPTEFYNPRLSLQDGFMTTLAADRLRPNQSTTQIPQRHITTNERPPEQINRSANDMIDDPPPYDSAVQEIGETVLPRKFPLEDPSFDSDISIIESPPSYFTVQENFPTTRS